MTHTWEIFEWMKAEFEEGRDEINRRCREFQDDHMAAAFQALLDGDTYGRDLSLENVKKAPEMRKAAIEELWFRIGEKYGISREEGRAILNRINTKI